MKSLAALLLLSTVLAQAGIEFEKTEIQKTAGHSDTETAAAFKFKITGEKDVTISDIQTYCSCLKASAKDGKTVFKPGEEGTIETLFQLGSFEGAVPKQVTVMSDDKEHPEIQLTVTVTIPVLYLLEPAQVSWVIGDEPTPKSMKLTIMGEKEIKVTGVVSSRDGMVITSKELKTGREYELTFSPKSTAEPMLGLARVETDAPYARYQKKLVFFNVTKFRPPADKAAPAPATAAPTPAPVAKPAPAPTPTPAPAADAAK